MKPPSISNTKSSPYALAMSSFVNTPTNGNIANGMIDVAGIGIGSKIHQTTHSVTMAPVQQALVSQPEAFMLMAIIKANKGPKTNGQDILGIV